MKQADTTRYAEGNALPDRFPVTVVMEKRPAQSSQWIDHVWQAVGITVGDAQDFEGDARVDNVDGESQLQFHSGFQVSLFVDECGSYYHNLMSPSPKCYIIVRQDEEDDEPLPFLVSLSFDEAHAYLEGDDAVFTAEIPPELYRWTEAFVLAHYCPQKLKKRKRKDWRGSEKGRQAP